MSIPRFILRGIGRGSYHVFEVKVCDSLYVVLFRFALFDLSGVDPFVLSRTIVQFNLYFNKVSQMFFCGFWVKKIFIISRSSLYVKSFPSVKEMYMIRVELVLRKKKLN